MPSITAIVLTFNEELHIRRCLNNLVGLVNRVCVVDSLSTDRTVDIAKECGADVFIHPWKNYASQFQWALDNVHIVTDWTMRIDADEYIDSKLKESILCFVKAAASSNAAAVFRRRIVFLGQDIRHGFFYPGLMLRLWKTGSGYIEQRWMDEHIIVPGASSETLVGDLIDENLNDLTWWTTKHIGYARREVYDMVLGAQTESSVGRLEDSAKLKRILKTNFYYRLSPLVRGGAYFLYRYIIGRGFLDGKAGLYFHFLQAFWYRTLVDAMFYELTLEAGKKRLTLRQLLISRGVTEP